MSNKILNSSDDSYGDEDLSFEKDEQEETSKLCK